MQYDMVFEGGGAKGMVFVGALREVENRKHTLGRMIGTSAGAITATMLAAGYDSAEMYESLKEVDENGQPVFMGFLEKPTKLSPEEVKKSAVRELLRDVNLKFVPDGLEEKIDNAIASSLASSKFTSRLFSFIEYGGFFKADNFLSWLRKKLNSGTYSLESGAHPIGSQREFGDMTLAEFFTATGVDLSLVGSDTTGAQLLILNHNTAPDLPVAWATRMSMSIPLLWYEVVWQKEWGTYLGKDITGHTIVDGGMLSNFPIELLISNEPQVTALMGEKSSSEPRVLGFLIDEDKEVIDAPPGDAPEKKGINLGELPPIERIQNLINTMTQAHDKMVIDAFERFVIRLPAGGYGTIEFGMNDTRRDALVKAGEEATKAFFTKMKRRTRGTFTFSARGLGGKKVMEQADRIATKLLTP